MTSHEFYDDEEERRRWQNPESILVDIGLKPDFTFVDVGCGSGFFALPAARLVGEQGRVYGLDEDSDAICRLRKRAAKEGLGNLNLKVGEAEETVLCRSCADIVFFGIVLHDFRDPTRVLGNAKRMLKPTGKLVNLDWEKEPMELGPPLKRRFSKDKAVSLIQAAGFKLETIRKSGPNHYIITAKP